MEAFASKDDMEARTRGAITVATHPYLENELDAASRLIRDECGWHIAKVESLTYKRVSRFPDIVFLPAMRIASVESAKVNGIALDLDQVEFDPDTGGTNIIGRAVEIEFTAGFADVPESVAATTLQVAARALGSPLGAVREQTLVSSVQWSATGAGVAGGAVILDSERSALTAYRLGRLP